MRAPHLWSPSPNVRQHFEPTLQRAWPALSPTFSYEAGLVSFLPLSEASRAEYRALGAQKARAALGELDASGPSQTTPYLHDIMRAGAYIKLGALHQADAVLASLAVQPSLAGSCVGPQPAPWVQLMQAHPLWSLMHVAIEHGQGARLWPVIAQLGLLTLCHNDAHRASGLMLNAIKQGDLTLLRLLSTAAITLNPSGRAQLQDSAQRMVRAWSQAHVVVQENTELGARVSLMQQGYALADPTLVPFVGLAAQSVLHKNWFCRKVVAGAHRPWHSLCSGLDQPARTNMFRRKLAAAQHS